MECVLLAVGSGRGLLCQEFIVFVMNVLWLLFGKSETAACEDSIPSRDVSELLEPNLVEDSLRITS